MELTRQADTDTESLTQVDQRDPHERVAELLGRRRGGGRGGVGGARTASGAWGFSETFPLPLPYRRQELSIGFGNSGWYVTLELEHERLGCIAFGGSSLPDAFRSLATGGDGVRDDGEERMAQIPRASSRSVAPSE